ncbi:LysE family translocator [Sphingomonas sp. C3-2]|uniref:LysE family translocator n=1 Tax=Sphingomonas sp. C3-2 TaxID=3062169 RepID=UPI00294B4DAA|nr:LysE family translocator [Sphingomonas sp. C3-2]WOK35636.1 LysE family translocator [Sphingomonas sp. C3-2]
MTLHNWWLFFAAVFLLCGTPGPNMLHVMTRSVHFGFRRSIAAMAGCLSAMMIVLAASAAGLTALLLAFPVLFDILRYLGVAYLVYLGIKAWRENDAPIDIGTDTLGPTLSPAQLFRGGLFIGLSNPKLLLFASAFLPQFIDRAAPEAPQFAILVVTFLTTEMFWYGVYALGGRRIAPLLARPGLNRAFNRLTAIIFMGFGFALLRARP